jgi:hypothetical protein
MVGPMGPEQNNRASEEKRSELLPMEMVLTKFTEVN